MYQIDIKFDRQLRPATETSWVVSYGGKTIPKWRTAAILKIDRHISVKNNPIFMKFCILAADFELDKRHVIKNEKVALDRLRVRQNVFLLVHERLQLRTNFNALNFFRDPYKTQQHTTG